jgi:bifunctional non-homologous end joining protein LigD
LWDGFRAIATIRNGELDLRSRQGTDMRPWFPELAALAVHIGRDVVLYGEVVALNADGRPDFYALRRSHPTFVAFDILRLDGRDLTPLPLRDRRRILGETFSDKLLLVLRSRPFLDGTALMAEADRLGLYVK